MRYVALFLFVLSNLNGNAQRRSFEGSVYADVSHLPLEDVTVHLFPGNQAVSTDINGIYKFRNVSRFIDSVKITAVGYKTITLKGSSLRNGSSVYLTEQQTMLSDITITGNTPNPYKGISDIDIKMRGVSNSQEVLRIVPGLFIGQHQGGGKAEQIFLRGFDNDHGTDINLSVDGMLINMVSHAHGQGYADSHFIIPETIESTTYKKGPYDAEKGDLAVTGSVDFHTFDALSNNLIKAEVGQFNTYRILGMANLLDSASRAKQRSWYAASEYRYSDSYFDNPQHFNRFNFFTKYHGHLSKNNVFSIAASTFYSKWNASGQIPESAVAKREVGFYGALDPNEGGVTSRTNFNAQLLTILPNNDVIKNQLYYSNYKFDLHTNFTFYLVDTVNGDEIRQRESRNLFGYYGSYLHEGLLGEMRLTTDAGVQLRFDATNNSELSHTVSRYTVVNPIKLGDVLETANGLYLNETLKISPKLTLNAGLRYDHLTYRYNNKLATDSTFNGIGIYKAANGTLSPKLNTYYQVSSKTQLYLFLGKGFHSNDARVIVAQTHGPTLPSAYSLDLGTVLKPGSNLLLNAALWYSYLEKEYVYGGDGGTVEFSGATRRMGFDLSARYQPLKPLLFDADVNYAHGRAVDGGYIPLAPVWSSTGGLTCTSQSGLNGSLRYRYLADRPANEDYSLTATGYFINDLVLNYTKGKYEIGITINNLFNVRWKETQFETITRLKSQAAVDGIAFTPGTKFAALAHFALKL
ncbi:TonB-dependent receptor [Mucilaginibacter ginkgonis]|uniref:TonB-dependent receptor n=1 Tax=Mucilaginibacter ginkgonis TaxID=2682091 RepID=A0A6I4HZ81_9SPHI|nr:TonB-dependent receptor [Mucilaginibacter ginkgonis]QQL50228.1 TonB-dependent receptor [Mucilaginibacter ginkgonis]